MPNYVKTPVEEPVLVADSCQADEFLDPCYKRQHESESVVLSWCKKNQRRNSEETQMQGRLPGTRCNIDNIALRGTSVGVA